MSKKGKLKGMPTPEKAIPENLILGKDLMVNQLKLKVLMLIELMYQKHVYLIKVNLEKLLQVEEYCQNLEQKLN